MTIALPAESSGVDTPSLTDVLTLVRRSPDEPREAGNKSSLRELYETDIASISGHLAAMYAFVFPLAERRLPDGRAQIEALRSLGGVQERLLRVIQGRLRGDVHMRGATIPELEERLAVTVTSLQEGERALAAKLESTLTDTELARLTRVLIGAGRRAPTRPHPHIPHIRGLRRLGFRLSAAADHALDSMESRVVTAR